MCTYVRIKELGARGRKEVLAITNMTDEERERAWP